MIQVKDKDGRILLEVSDQMFPLKLSTKQKWGNANYKLWLNFLHDGEGDKIVKSMNLSKD